MFRSSSAKNILFFAWLISLLATAGSLFASLVLKYEPCTLCWYERIFMFPLPILLGVALVKEDYKIGLYTSIVSFMGAFISLYHYLVQKVPFFHDKVVACQNASCSQEYINLFGFITFPLVAFIAIGCCSVSIRNKKKGLFF